MINNFRSFRGGWLAAPARYATLCLLDPDGFSSVRFALDNFKIGCQVSLHFSTLRIFIFYVTVRFLNYNVELIQPSTNTQLFHFIFQMAHNNSKVLSQENSDLRVIPTSTIENVCT